MNHFALHVFLLKYGYTQVECKYIKYVSYITYCIFAYDFYCSGDLSILVTLIKYVHSNKGLAKCTSNNRGEEEEHAKLHVKELGLS